MFEVNSDWIAFGGQDRMTFSNHPRISIFMHFHSLPTHFDRTQIEANQNKKKKRKKKNMKIICNWKWPRAANLLAFLCFVSCCMSTALFTYTHCAFICPTHPRNHITQTWPHRPFASSAQHTHIRSPSSTIPFHRIQIDQSVEQIRFTCCDMSANYESGLYPFSRRTTITAWWMDRFRSGQSSVINRYGELERCSRSIVID